jgi:zinc protease
VPADDLELALHTESLRMSGILATEELWGKERGAIEQEVAQDLSNPEYVLYMKLLAAMFKGTPYEHDALGHAALVRQDDGRDAESFLRSGTRRTTRF